MTKQEEFLVGLAKRLRELRMHLGYETAASFARAIGYPPHKYSRYERRGITQTGVLMRLVRAIKTSGHGQVGYDGLFDFKPGPMVVPQGKLAGEREARPT